MRTKEIQLKPIEAQAMDIYANNPEITHREVAITLGITEKTLRKIRRNPEYQENLYNYYMVTFNEGVIKTLNSMLRESWAGNVQAGRIVLEHSGKFQNNDGKDLSPFDKWVIMQIEKQEKGTEVGIDAEDAEIVEDIPNFPELPPRTADNSPLKTKKELNKLQNIPQKAKSIKNRNKARREAYKWNKRAEAAGVKPLPAKRPTPNQKKVWRDKVIAAEKKASQPPLARAGNNKTPCKPKSQKQEVPKTPTLPKT